MPQRAIRTGSTAVIVPAEALATAAQSAFRIEYAASAPLVPLPDDVLAAVEFGATGAVPGLDGDPRRIRVPLRVLSPGGRIELWRTAGPIETGRSGPIRFAYAAECLAGAIELDEREYGGLAAAAEEAYTLIRRFQRRCAHPHLLRAWNYFDGINHGTDDEERYKQFCLGRAAGLGALPPHRYPAATAIGRRDGGSLLQVFWLAGRSAGISIENPRQLSAYRYPRRYGPAAPSFSRAMLVPPGVLLISGTASITGHASRHPGSLPEQTAETLHNLASILARAEREHPICRSGRAARSLLKVYLRDGQCAAETITRLQEQLPETPLLALEADICRAELLVEIDCVHHFEVM